jgi:hypothetical protein
MAHLLGIRMAKIRRHFPLDAPFRAGAARLRTLADRVDKALRDRRRQWAWWGLALLPVLIALGVGIYRTGSDWLVGGLCIGGFIDLILFGYALTYRTSADILLARDLSGALNRWRLDVHADSPRSRANSICAIPAIIGPSARSAAGVASKRSTPLRSVRPQVRPRRRQSAGFAS